MFGKNYILLDIFITIHKNQRLYLFKNMYFGEYIHQLIV